MSTRAPPGSWRLLAPALLGWAGAAWAVAHPGTGAWLRIAGLALMSVPVLLLCCGGAATAMASLGRRRVGAARPGEAARGTPSGPAPLGARAIAGAAAVVRWCAVLSGVLLLLGLRIEHGETARADPGLAAAADAQRTIELEVTATGYADLDAVGGGLQLVDARARGEAGDVPVLLWVRAAAGSPGFAALASVAPGSAIEVAGRLTPLEPGARAAYGIGVDGERVGVRPAEGVAERLAAELRRRLREASAGVPGAELVPGFAVGDTALVGAALESEMQRSSLTHLVAVSGANCALVTGALAWAASMLGAGRRVRAVVAAGALAGFVIVVGPDASVQRAAVMAAVLLVSGFGGKRAVSLPALGAAIAVLLVADPWQALQPGFALSVAATCGILLLAPGIASGLAGRLRLPTWLALPLAVAIAAQAACGPLLLLLQPGIPAVGVLANVLAAPAAPAGTGVGLVALLLLPIVPGLGELAVRAAALPARWVAATARVTSELPLAAWPWPGGWGGAALLAAVEAAAAVAVLILVGRVRVPLPRRQLRGASDRASDGDPRAGPTPWAPRPGVPRAARRVAAVLLGAALGAFAGPTVVRPAAERAGTPADWAIVMCDVGQGDAFLLRDPADPEATVLVDTGDDPELLTACLDRFGVRTLDRLVLTHDDADHVGAVGALAGRVDRALIAPASAGQDRDRPLLRDLARLGIEAEVGAAGDVGSSGSGVAWEVLAPEPGTTPGDTNAASLVLRLEVAGVRVLMLADTGAEEQRRLRHAGVDLAADVLKVAHHGSGDFDPETVAATGATTALVSVGADNGYGHPHRDALGALAGAGMRVLRTDRNGAVAINPDPASSTALGVWVARKVE